MAHFTARQYVSPSHGEAQQEREPELSVCVDEPEGIIKQESGAGFGCPREQQCCYMCVWLFGVPHPCHTGAPWHRLGRGHQHSIAACRQCWPWSLQVPPHGQAECAC